MKNSNIQQLLERYGISPNKVLGQNFLISEDAISSFVEAANISEDDVVIEVGPGTGVITKELVKKACMVIAVEKDPVMVRVLKDELVEHENVKILNKDILKLEMSNVEAQMPNEIQNPNAQLNYILVGAIPYYLSGKLFRKFLEQEKTPPSSMTLIVQKEVAKKAAAKPPSSNLLANSIQLYGGVKVAKKISKSFFWPQPKVDSAILAIEDIKKPNIDEKLFFKVLRAGFSSPRKQLLVNLASSFGCSKEEAGEWLKSSNIEPTRRAQTLTIEEWKTIVDKAQKYI